MKRLFLLMCVFVIGCSSLASADSWRVFDNAKLFSADDIDAIEEAIFEFQRKTNLDFAVLTTDDFLGSENQKAIADSFYGYMNFGFGYQDSGMIYYIDMNQRIPYISTCGQMVAMFADEKLYDAHDACFPLLSKGAYKDAVLKMIELATDAVMQAKKDAN